MTSSGLYIVKLSNENFISVNAHDQRIAERCLHVNLKNCKVGRAKNLAAREKCYWRTFGESFVTFDAIALTEDLNHAEKVVLTALNFWRARSPSGRRTEWLSGIEPHKAVALALAALSSEKILFQSPAQNRNADSVHAS